MGPVYRCNLIKGSLLSLQTAFPVLENCVPAAHFVTLQPWVQCAHRTVSVDAAPSLQEVMGVTPLGNIDSATSQLDCPAAVPPKGLVQPGLREDLRATVVPASLAPLSVCVST